MDEARAIFGNDFNFDIDMNEFNDAADEEIDDDDEIDAEEDEDEEEIEPEYDDEGNLIENVDKIIVFSFLLKITFDC